MFPLLDPLPQAQARGASVRMRTLNSLRWLAIAGQGVALFVATEFFDVAVPLDRCAMLIASSAAFTIAMSLVYPASKRFSNRDAMLTLVFDLCQLGAMLYFTGGLNNPFAVLVMVQTTISAAVLSVSATLILGAITGAMISLLARFHVPLRTADGMLLEMPEIMILGFWVALMIGVLFLAVFAWRVTQENYSMAEALSATQLALERERKLAAVGGIVAAAAHELGTPLATIKLTSTELAEELADADHRADVELIRTQADRCSRILHTMGKHGTEDTMMRDAPLQALVEEAAAPHLGRGVEVMIRVDASADPTRQPHVLRQPEFLHGLRNLVQNAVDFASSSVWVDLFWDGSKVRITVGDDGKGFPSGLLNRIGEPLARRKAAARAGEQRPGYDGMGLGLFIAKTLLERSGARLTFVNAASRRTPISDEVDLPRQLREPTGAIVELLWDRSTLEGETFEPARVVT